MKEIIQKANEWHDRIVKLSTESEHRDHILEHADVLSKLIKIAKKHENE